MREPPKLATALLKRVSTHGSPLAGDLIEAYNSGRSGCWYWRQLLGAIVLVEGSALQRNMEAMMEKTAAYVIGALALGGLTATVQGFGIGSSHWFASAIGGPVTGAVVGGAVRLFATTNPVRWTFWMSAAVLVITVLGAQCAMCWFI